jgi:DhnA family fructose-bisphosphate aldolase class Ia
VARRGPALVLAADHRARGILTVERYGDLLSALCAALPYCDAVMATTQPLGDVLDSRRSDELATYLSLNRTGLAGSVFELDDRLIASVDRAAAEGCTGIKHMIRIDRDNPLTASGLELLGRVIEEADTASLDAMIEPLTWRRGVVDRTVEGIVGAATIAHDMGAPLLKVPVPQVEAGPARVEAVSRVTASVGVPVLFLGGPRRSSRRDLLAELVDAMAGGAAGAAVGRAIYQDPDPARMASLVSDVVREARPPEEVLAEAEEIDSGDLYSA